MQQLKDWVTLAVDHIVSGELALEGAEGQDIAHPTHSLQCLRGALDWQPVKWRRQQLNR